MKRKVYLRLFGFGAPALGLTILFIICGLTLGTEISMTANLSQRCLPPGWRAENGETFLLGTDQLGRDLAEQILAGGSLSVFVALVSVFISAVVGSLVGLLAGFVGGWVDLLIMRVVDLQLALPPLFLAVLLAGLIGPSLFNLIIALSIIRWAIFARLTRGLSLQIREQSFVEAARALGASHLRIICRHLLPNTIDSITIVATSQIGFQILAESAVSFLGFGIRRPLVSWGLLISEGRQYLSTAWWISTFPGLALMIYVFSMALFGDALSDYLTRRDIL